MRLLVKRHAASHDDQRALQEDALAPRQKRRGRASSYPQPRDTFVMRNVV